MGKEIEYTERDRERDMEYLDFLLLGCGTGHLIRIANGTIDFKQAALIQLKKRGYNIKGKYNPKHDESLKSDN